MKLSWTGPIEATMLFVFFLMLILSLFVAWFPQGLQVQGPKTYETVTIKGMPCIKYSAGSRAALTCNWDEWEREGNDAP